MDETVKTIKNYYNANVDAEWNRIAGRPEFLITRRFIDRYIKSGDNVLDIGGGPGRYSFYLAYHGCDVTLFDLSDENIRFALEHAKEQNVKIHAVTGDARSADEYFSRQFDHILLMGPMYHLQKETDRIKAVDSALKLLKPGGILFVSFISSYGGVIYLMKNAPGLLASTPAEIGFMDLVIEDKPFAGLGFTECNCERYKDILPFFQQFPLQKLHFFGQESILSPCEEKIMSQPETVINRWLDFAEKLCEREDFLSWAEHLMYIGRKI